MQGLFVIAGWLHPNQESERGRLPPTPRARGSRRAEAFHLWASLGPCALLSLAGPGWAQFELEMGTGCLLPASLSDCEQARLDPSDRSGLSEGLCRTPAAPRCTKGGAVLSKHQRTLGARARPEGGAGP